ncbi:MAG: hypothetical protein EKK57_02280 [Proteobacteria bacterium]|nr:MAG: hypothetical protein EKK57_02280 [Pseudomonadota bacterium]
MDQSNLLSLLYAENAEISAYRERNFGCLHLIQPHYKCANTYNHIKQKTRNYLMFDIDNIQIDKVNLLFNNDFFTPNFYVYEYSRNKKCYTLQVFVLLNHNFIADKIKNIYKKMCLLFGADTQYQIKTGIHKNPMYYKQIDIDEYNIKIPNLNHCGYIHNRKYDLDTIESHLADFGYFDNLPNIDYIDDYNNFFAGFDNLDSQPELASNTNFITVKPVHEVKKTKKTTNKDIGFRNIELFEKTRLIVYSMSDQSMETILHIAHKINAEFNKPLKNTEVNATAKSIYKFITEKFGKTKVDPYSALQRAKSIEVRKNEAIEKMKFAIISLMRANKNITFSAIKTKTKQNINTIKNNFAEAYKQANDYEVGYAKRQAQQEKRSQKEFKKLCKTLLNKPIRTRKKRVNIKKEVHAKIANNPIVATSIPIDLMPNFDTSCDFIFNNRR